jgi:hypothetical protein
MGMMASLSPLPSLFRLIAGSFMSGAMIGVKAGTVFTITRKLQSECFAANPLKNKANKIADPARCN